MWLRFEDGASGTVDVAELIPFDGVFEALKEAEFFAQVAVDREMGSIYWPNGADLDPDVLYARVTGNPAPYFDDRPEASRPAPARAGGG